MALTLYRRHRRECKAGHSEQSFSTEFEERKRGWKRFSGVTKADIPAGTNIMVFLDKPNEPAKGKLGVRQSKTAEA